MVDAREYWNQVWNAKDHHDVSWYQADPQPCLEWIEAAASASSNIVIVGAGVSTLISSLVAQRYVGITAVDISAEALGRLRDTLGEDADRVATVVSDVCDFVPTSPVDVWHDRATFHFLTDQADQLRYVARAAAAVRDRGALILATFAPDGPEQCSGLPVTRWTADDLAERFAPYFELQEQRTRLHATPWGTNQAFTHVLMTRRNRDVGG